MENNPKVLQLIDEVELSVCRLDDRLAHVLLPTFPTSAESKNQDAPESTVTAKLRRVLRHLGEINDRVEG